MRNLHNTVILVLQLNSTFWKQQIKSSVSKAETPRCFLKHISSSSFVWEQKPVLGGSLPSYKIVFLSVSCSRTDCKETWGKSLSVVSWSWRLTQVAGRLKAVAIAAMLREWGYSEDESLLLRVRERTDISPVSMKSPLILNSLLAHLSFKSKNTTLSHLSQLFLGHSY